MDDRQPLGGDALCRVTDIAADNSRYPDRISTAVRPDLFLIADDVAAFASRNACRSENKIRVGVTGSAGNRNNDMDASDRG